MVIVDDDQPPRDHIVPPLPGFAASVLPRTSDYHHLHPCGDIAVTSHDARRRVLMDRTPFDFDLTASRDAFGDDDMLRFVDEWVRRFDESRQSRCGSFPGRRGCASSAAALRFPLTARDDAKQLGAACAPNRGPSGRRVSTRSPGTRGRCAAPVERPRGGLHRRHRRHHLPVARRRPPAASRHGCCARLRRLGGRRVPEHRAARPCHSRVRIRCGLVRTSLRRRQRPPDRASSSQLGLLGVLWQ